MQQLADLISELVPLAAGTVGEQPVARLQWQLGGLCRTEILCWHGFRRLDGSIGAADVLCDEVCTIALMLVTEHEMQMTITRIVAGAAVI